MRYSVIRRSLIVTAFFIAGHGFYYLLLLIANNMLDPPAFGRLYTAWAILNVLVTPVSIIALLLSANFAREHNANGPAAATRLLTRTAVIVLPWTAGSVVLLEALFYVGGILIGTDSAPLILIIPLTAASFLGVEIVRAYFQGMLRVTVFGLSWFLWCAAQCALGTTGILLTGAPWGCFAGMLAANILTLGCVSWLVDTKSATIATTVASPAQNLTATPSLRRAVLFCSAFVGFVLFNNADVLLAYFTLSPSELGAYTSSSVLPKAIVTATQPVVQIILPVVVIILGEGRDTSQAVQKAISMAFALGALAFLMLWTGADLACGTSHGIRFCNAPLMLTLAAAAVPLSVIRILITADVAHGRYWLSHSPFVAIIIFSGILMATRILDQFGEMQLATDYLISCWGLLLCWAAIRIATGRFLGQRHKSPSVAS